MNTTPDAITLTEAAPGVARITLNQPSTRNSLSLNMLRLLGERVEVAQANKDYKVVIIAATGYVFCARHNLNEVQQQRCQIEAQLALFELCSEVMQKVVQLPKQVIAEV